jgi:outer membrane receptor for ferrienterochelin and colicin
MDKYSMEVDPAISEPEIYFNLFPERTDGTGGIFMDVVLNPRGRIQVIPGIRADVFSSLGKEAFAVDPRLFAEYQLTSDLKAIHGIGVSHQSPNFVPSIPGAQVAGLEGGLQQSLHASTKYEAQLPWSLTGSLAFYLNGTDVMTDPIGLSQSLAIDETSADHRALGRSAGMEVYFKRPLTQNLGGLLSYTFSHTLRSFDSITTVPGYDRPHVINGALTYDFGKHFRASGRVALASGIPGRRTTEDGFIYDESRSGPYARLDLKLAKKWYVSEHFHWGAHIEVLNATHTGNVTRRECNVGKCVNEGTAPITFPSVGLDASWQ